jgi:eukaryotic-like serine/threonine-protein kinase
MMTEARPIPECQDGSDTRPVSPSTARGRPDDWTGNARFAIRRRIGEGGMGVVYEALDRERGHSVAVKTLTHFDPAALYRFKQEFRTLADVVHPNLVRLHELVLTDGEHAFFTMELITGVDFRTYVRRQRNDNGVASGSRSPSTLPPRYDEPTSTLRQAGAVRQHTNVERSLRETPADFDKLREAMRQLVRGISALHGAGKLHRDIKPSNVLVTPEGRVVVLDFGVSTELSRVFDQNLAETDEVVGTVSYMSPEQALAEKLSPASDWYSVGVVLYEALVGGLPFVGSSVNVLTMKTVGDPVPPSERVADVPPDLDSLCRDLLSRDPERRPGAPEILRRLGRTESLRAGPSVPPVQELGKTKIGRAHV